MFLDIPGENFKGVYSANEYLTRVDLMGAWLDVAGGTSIARGETVAVFGGGNVAMDTVRTARLQRMELGEPDASGRRRPVPVPGSEFELLCQMVVVALGTTANPLLTQTAPAPKLNTCQYIVVDEPRATAMEGVFAGGDIVRGGATVILAMGDGMEAARSIDAYLKPRTPKRKA